MKKDTANNVTLACNLTAFDPEQRQRHLALTQQLHAAVQEIRELPNGYAFRLLAESSMCLAVAEFITLERLCCPFLYFVLEVDTRRWSALAENDRA